MSRDSFYVDGWRFSDIFLEKILIIMKQALRFLVHCLKCLNSQILFARNYYSLVADLSKFYRHYQTF